MTDFATIRDAHSRAIATFAELLRTVDGNARMKHLKWNVGELAAHVLGGIRAYERAVDGIEVWDDLRAGPEANERMLQATPEREPAEIARLLPEATARLHQKWAGARGPVTWSGGVRLPVEVVAGLLFTDVLVHTWDLAQASRSAWRLAPEDAITAIDAPLAIAPHFVAPAASGFTGTFEIRLRGDDSLTLAFDNGDLTVTRGRARRADCRISADPAAFLLTAYGRIPLWRVAATGKVMAWGRKPWLGLKFNSLLVQP